jgi:hypothetical protein
VTLRGPGPQPLDEAVDVKHVAATFDKAHPIRLLHTDGAFLLRKSDGKCLFCDEILQGGERPHCGV